MTKYMTEGLKYCHHRRFSDTLLRRGNLYCHHFYKKPYIVFICCYRSASTATLFYLSCSFCGPLSESIPTLYPSKPSPSVLPPPSPFSLLLETSRRFCLGSMLVTCGGSIAEPVTCGFIFKQLLKSLESQGLEGFHLLSTCTMCCGYDQFLLEFLST